MTFIHQLLCLHCFGCCVIKTKILYGCQVQYQSDPRVPNMTKAFQSVTKAMERLHVLDEQYQLFIPL